MDQFRLSHFSLDKLKNVHPDLIKVVKLAITLTDTDFSVISGVRDLEKQSEFLKNGTTKTLNSRHLTGHAVDLMPYTKDGVSIIGKTLNQKENWHYFVSVADAMKKAANQLIVDLIWGGNWKTIIDGYHFELSWKNYPLK